MEKQKEGYEAIRDRRESKYGRMIFYAFLACVIIGFIIVAAFGMMDQFSVAE